MKIVAKQIIGVFTASLVTATLLTGCPEWNSAPLVVQQNFGMAAKNMVKNQTLYPEHGKDDHPILSMDGQKAAGIVKAYREPSQYHPEDSKRGASFTVKSAGASEASSK